MKNSFEKKQIARDIFISDLKIKKPYLNFTNPTIHNEGIPFLRRAHGIISHEEAQKIINGLLTFYEIYSKKDIEDINTELKEIAEDF